MPRAATRYNPPTMPGKSLALQAEEAQAVLDGRTGETKYNPAFVLRARDYALLGATNEEMAGLFGVSPSTFNRWLVENPRFRAALMENREAADGRVARALYRRAVGMRVKKEKAFNVAGELQTIVVKEELPPDVNAAALWLSNRQRGKWRAANAGAEAGNAFDLSAFASAIAEGVARAQAQPGDDAKPVDLLDDVPSEPKG